jgi:hypothetical protein
VAGRGPGYLEEPSAHEEHHPPDVPIAELPVDGQPERLPVEEEGPINIRRMQQHPAGQDLHAFNMSQVAAVPQQPSVRTFPPGSFSLFLLRPPQTAPMVTYVVGEVVSPATCPPLCGRASEPVRARPTRLNLEERSMTDTELNQLRQNLRQQFHQMMSEPIERTDVSADGDRLDWSPKN